MISLLKYCLNCVGVVQSFFFGRHSIQISNSFKFFSRSILFSFLQLECFNMNTELGQTLDSNPVNKEREKNADQSDWIFFPRADILNNNRQLDRNFLTKIKFIFT